MNNDPLTNQVKATTNQDTIAEARKLVDGVRDGALKKELQPYFDIAKSLLKKQDEMQGEITTHDYVLGVDRYVTGTYVGDVSFITVTIDGKEYRGGTVINGEFKFYTFDKILFATSEVIVNAYNASNELLDTRSVVLKSSVDLTKGHVTLATFTIGDKNITGTYAHDVKSFIVTVNGTSYKGGTFHGESGFKFYVLDKIKTVDDIVTIQALDKANKVLDTKSVMVKAANVTTIGSVTLDIFTIGDKNLIGTYTHDVKSIILTVNGVNYKGGTFHSDGTFKFYAIDKIKKVGDIVSLEAFDKSGKLLDTKNVILSMKTAIK
ncbi:immunoglobulin-like domain-containing protein [Listeria grandensis]|uniref:immunoglobulin-like domain-containing protein n=1 Tax=Listeria grandensis TaxID=1494963 RepID=UPI00164DAFEB|nr:immunoglobulin-like domain-containing protein [Listeria grandensis]MBC6316737.1 hypothetical protein [Listeria grandensis]